MASKLLFQANSENDFTFIQEHLYGQRNDFKVQDSTKAQVLQALNGDVVLQCATTLPPVSQGKALKNILLAGGLSKLEGYKEALLKKRQELRTPFSFEFAEADGYEVGAELFGQEKFWQ